MALLICGRIDHTAIDYFARVIITIRGSTMLDALTIYAVDIGSEAKGLYSLAGAALLRAGLSADIGLLSRPCLGIQP